jgi:hypothetical protein
MKLRGVETRARAGTPRRPHEKDQCPPLIYSMGVNNPTHIEENEWNLKRTECEIKKK